MMCLHCEFNIYFKIKKMKTTTLFILFLSLIIANVVTAATNQYALSYRDDPATTLVIGWSGDNGTVYYGTTDEGTNYTAYPLNKAVDRIGNAHGHSRKFARLSDLTPNTMYYFVIHDSQGQTSARFKFRTLSDNPNDPISYVTGGDSRDGFKVFGQYVESCPSGDCREMRREGNRLVAKINPDFVAFNGDYVMNQINSNTFNEWTQWFTDWQLTISPDGRMYPTLHTQGNHEDNSDMYHMFDVPQEEYYALNINGGLIRMYFLNSELNACSNATQLNWINNDFTTHSTGGSADPLWKFVQYHIPTFAMGNGYGLVSDQMSCWVNLFEQYDVRLVSESHTHITKWTHPCKKNSGNTDFINDPNGIVYIGEGQWGAPHRTLDFTGANQKTYIRDQEVFDNFFFVRVTQNEATVRSVKFLNIAGVAQSTDDNLGSDLPGGVTLWNPSNGNTVVLARATGNVPSLPTFNFQLFPNPASDIISIEFDTQMESGSVEVYNGLGKLCLKEEIKGMKHQMDISNLCSGVNYIYIKDQKGNVQVEKLIKK